MHGHHDHNEAAGLLGACLGFLGHILNTIFNFIPPAVDNAVDSGLRFLNLAWIHPEDIHSIIMAAICALVGFCMTKGAARVLDYLLPKKSK